jgi:hypothetical protein
VEHVTDINKIPVAVYAVTGRKYHISVPVESVTDADNIPVTVDAVTGKNNIIMCQWRL